MRRRCRAYKECEDDEREQKSDLPCRENRIYI
jgi:hypothetical protein